MNGTPWRPGRGHWPDDEGTTWTRRKPKWLDERSARRLVRRTSTLVAVERGGGAELVWLADPATRRRFWADHVAGHVDDASGACVLPNDEAITYRVTSWIDDRDRRLILLSAIC